jgi:hypothetical protein
MSRHVANERAKAKPAMRALSLLKPGVPMAVFEQKNNGCAEVGEKEEEEANDSLLCFGYRRE